jgi:hypothetical protein
MRPRAAAAGAGSSSAIAGARCERGMRPSSAYTTADSGGRVSVSRRFAPVRSDAGPSP